MISLTAMAVILSFAQLSVNAQEKKEEKKVIKVVVQADDDGEVRIDTTIILNGDFDGNWKELITDEDLRKKVEEIDIKVMSDDDGKIMVMTQGKAKQKYMYITTTEEDGEMQVEVEEITGGDGGEFEIEEIMGDSTKTFIIKHTSGDDDGKVMIWHSDGDDNKGAVKKDVIVRKLNGGKAVFISSSVEVSDIGETEKNMLADQGVKISKEGLDIDELEVSFTVPEGNIKVAFGTSGMSDLSVSLLDHNGHVIFMEELKQIKGKYIREMELTGPAKGKYFLHISSGKKSVIKKIALD